jgi:hypothetical protein
MTDDKQAVEPISQPIKPLKQQARAVTSPGAAASQRFCATRYSG